MAAGLSKKKLKMSLIRYETNPFLENMVVPVGKKNVRLSKLGRDSNIVLNTETGESAGTHVTTYRKVDSEQFVKVFTAHIGMTFEFTAAGNKTFGVLLWAMQHHALSVDEIDLDAITLSKFMKTHSGREPVLRLSLQTFNRGLAELVKAKIIAKTMRGGRYFINPNFVFNGDRLAFTTVLELKKPSDGDAENQQSLGLED